MELLVDEWIQLDIVFQSCLMFISIEISGRKDAMRCAHRVTIIWKGVFAFHYSVLCLRAVASLFSRLNSAILIASLFCAELSISTTARTCTEHIVDCTHSCIANTIMQASINFMNWDLLIVMWSSLCAVITLASIQLYHIFALWDAILSSTIAIDVLLLLVAK